MMCSREGALSAPGALRAGWVLSGVPSCRAAGGRVSPSLNTSPSGRGALRKAACPTGGKDGAGTRSRAGTPGRRGMGAPAPRVMGWPHAAL